MRIQLPVKVDNIIKTLEAAGYEAFAVGGCIRDSVLGRTPQDWDITTSAKPQDVKRLFSHTIDTGRCPSSERSYLYGEFIRGFKTPGFYD